MTGEQIAKDYLKKVKSLQLMLFVVCAVTVIASLLLKKMLGIFFCVFLAIAFKTVIGTWSYKFFNILIFECDPVKFYGVFKVLNDNCKVASEKFLLSLNYGQGLYYSGRFKEAYDVLTTMEIKKHKPIIMNIYYTTLADCCWKLGYIDKIDDILRQSDAVNRKISKKSAAYKEVEETHASIDSVKTDKINEYEVRRAEGILASSKNPLQKTVSHYTIARNEFSKGDYETANDHCDYVIKNGNSLFCVAEALKIQKEIKAMTTKKGK